MRNSGTPEKVQKGKDEQSMLLTEFSAYSTVFDALFLLVLISLAGVLLMSPMQAEKQYSAAGYVTSSELDTYMLESLLSCKLENFEYEISPLSALNISIPENSVVEDPSHTLFAKEQKHRTFADLIAEYLALSFKLSNKDSNNGSSNGSNNNSSVTLNPLATDYSLQDSEAISTYLDKRIAGRFSYRLEAYWHPVEVFPMRSELIIGEEPPVNAFRQSAKLSMPLYANAPSKDALRACVNDSVLEASLNSSSEEASRLLFQAFNSCLDTAAQEGAEVTVGLLFPSDYSGTGFEEEAGESLQTLLYGISENSEDNLPSTEEALVVYYRDTLETGFPLDFGTYPENPSSPENLSSPENPYRDDLSLFEKPLEAFIKNDIRARLEVECSGEVYETVCSIVETENLSEAQALRDSLIDSIYRQINPGGARIVLSLWDS